jgi:hypothetical protein
MKRCDMSAWVFFGCRCVLDSAMKKLLPSLILAAAFTATPAYSQANTQAIEGRVLRAGTLEPIPNVQVRLTWPNPSIPQTPEAISMAENLGTYTNPQIAAMQTSTFETRLGLAAGTLVASKQTAVHTDSDGRFTFKDVVPGRYRVRVQHDSYLPRPDYDGYISSSGALEEVTVEVGPPVARVDVLLTKGAIIAGRILDPNGLPIPGITVAANRVRYHSGRPVFDSAASQQTNDRGEYRLFWLAPGEYYISAELRATPAAPVSAMDKTFYPGVTEQTAITPVIVRDGAEVTNMNFAMRPLTAPTFTISGTAINPFARANPVTGAVDRTISFFRLVPRQLTMLDPYTAPQLQNAIPVQNRLNGEFEIRNVRPGSYDLYPQYQDTDLRRYLTNRTPVEIRNSNVTGLTIVVTPGVALSGGVVVEGPSPQAVKVESIRLSLWAADTLPGSFATIVEPIAVDANGKFTAGNVPQAKYRFTITGLPASAYVADVRQSGRSVYDGGFTLDSQADPVQIAVNPAGGTIEGIVMSAGSQKPVARAYVTLAPPAARGQNLALFKTAVTDDSGRFTLKGIAPGPYTLFSFDAIPWGAGQSAEFHAKYLDRGRSVTVEGGKTVQAQLDLISVPGLTASPSTDR